MGPLARLNTADFIPTPLAQKEFEEYKKTTGGRPNDMCMHTHWARLIETLHAAEAIKDLLEDPDITGGQLVVKGGRQPEGVGLIEAPRGTLFHHYRVNADRSDRYGQPHCLYHQQQRANEPGGECRGPARG